MSELLDPEGMKELLALAKRANQALRRWTENQGQTLAWEPCFRVATLSVELARLRSINDPNVCLPDAARLLVGAEKAWRDELERPARERREEAARAFRNFVQNDGIPLTKLYRPGKAEGGTAKQDEFEEFVVVRGLDGKRKSFRWKVYTSEKGFRELISAHFAKANAFGEGELRQLLDCDPPKTKKAKEWLEVGQYFHDAECRRRLGEVRTREDGLSYIDWWKKTADLVGADQFWQDSMKDGRIGVATVKALADTRSEANKVRSGKASQAKANKAAATRRVVSSESSKADAEPKESPAVVKTRKTGRRG